MNERIVVINLSDRTIETKEFEGNYHGVYGRGLVLELAQEFIPDEVGRYDSKNAIIIIPGLFVGNFAPSTCRMFVATAMDRDKGLEICNTTGNMPQMLGSMGIAGLVIIGKSNDRGTVLHISPDGIEFRANENLCEMYTSDLIHTLKEEYGKDSSIIGTGMVAERRLSLATFSCTYLDGEPEYHCPRSGFGDVWGSKNLKALVVNGCGMFKRDCADSELFVQIGRKVAKAIINDEVCGGALPSYGSITILKLLKSKASLDEMPVRQKVSGSARSKSSTRFNYNCAPGCVIGCLNKHADYEGEIYSSPALSETQAAINNCFGVDDFDLANQIQTKATELGIVGTEFVTACKTYAISLGVSNGEEHLIEWIKEVENDSLIGRVICSRTHGIHNLYRDAGLDDWIDKRAVDDEKLFQVNMNTRYPKLAHLSEMEMLYAQIFVLENLGFCIFTSFALLGKTETFELLAEMYTARTGFSITAEELLIEADRCIKAEKEYTEHRWKCAQLDDVPPFTKVLYRYFEKNQD